MAPLAVALLKRGLVAQGAGSGQLQDPRGDFRRQGLTRRIRDLPLVVVALSADLHALAIGQADPLEGLLVHRQGSGLVAGDQGAASQALDGHEATGDHLAVDHARGRDREGHGHGHRKTLGDRRDGHGHHQHEHLAGRHALPEDQPGAQESGEAQDDEADVMGKLLHPDQQGGLGRLGGDQRDRNAPHLGVDASAHGHADSPAAHHGGAGKGHVGAITDRSRLIHDFQPLVHGKGFPGQEGLVDGQAIRAGQPQIGGDLAARLQEDHVPGNQLLGRDRHLVPVAQGLGLNLQHDLQGVGLLFGPELLVGPDGRVEEDHREDEDRVLVVLHRQRHPPRDQQDVDQGAGKLMEEDREQAGGLRSWQGVGPELLQALTRLVGGEPGRLGPQEFANLVRSPVVPEDLVKSTFRVERCPVGGSVLPDGGGHKRHVASFRQETMAHATREHDEIARPLPRKVLLQAGGALQEAMRQIYRACGAISKSRAACATWAATA